MSKEVRLPVNSPADVYVGEIVVVTNTPDPLGTGHRGAVEVLKVYPGAFRGRVITSRPFGEEGTLTFKFEDHQVGCRDVKNAAQFYNTRISQVWSEEGKISLQPDPKLAKLVQAACRLP